jgi:hypothetical protein
MKTKLQRKSAKDAKAAKEQPSQALYSTGSRPHIEQVIAAINSARLVLLSPCIPFASFASFALLR